MPLATRSTAPELMDDVSVPPAVYDRCIADLASVNRVTFTHRATLRWLDRAVEPLPLSQEIAILDVAYGDGDLLRAIARWAVRRKRTVALSGIDLNPRSAIAARAATPADVQIAYHTGDVFGYVPATPVDFIVSSQFTHHLTNEDIVRLLQWFDKTALRGWYITDLHRHVLAYYGFPLLARLLRWHQIVRHDGQVSIARSFTGAEWRVLLQQAGVDAQVSWILPFRHGISSIK
jgi:2-polyprenyl-3-methyl-5-hydroxy-6-metoxy-1,4-benzoquinol methylase